MKEGMGYGKRALSRKQQAPSIALVRCNSPSKECSRPSLSSWPSSLPKHSRNVGKEEEVSTKDPQEFPHLGGRVIHATKATLKKRGVRRYPLVVRQSSRTGAMHSVSCCEFHSQVPSTWKQRKTQMNHWNLPVDVGTLSCRVSMMYLGVHMQKTKTICVYTQLWQK